MKKATNIIFSAIIPAKDKDDPKLKDLIQSIKAQDFPQDKIEILVITQGDSEQAKAIGIRRAKGEICAMFCADNMLVDPEEFLNVHAWLTKLESFTGMYPRIYFKADKANSLDRYFALIGGNDIVSYYLRKNDRQSWFEVPKDVAIDFMVFDKSVPSLGDNGFYYRRSHLIKANLGNYYPMDCAEDLRRLGYNRYLRGGLVGVWHRTSDNLISFLIKRYKYARDLYSDREDRRWKMVDGAKDYWRLFGFIIFTLTLIQPIFISIRGFRKVRDWAWFWHPVVCLGFLVTYTILVCRNILKHRFVFQRSIEKKLSSVASEA